MINFRLLRILRAIVRKDPIFITLIYIAFVWIILIFTIYFGKPGIRESYSIISFITSIIITAIPVAITFYHIGSYRKTLSSFIRLFSLVVQIVLLFGTIYFIMQTMSFVRGIEANQPHEVVGDSFPFSNVDKLWYHRLINNEPDKTKTLYYALLSYQDCIHFSLVTSSTVGYGDIAPKSHMAKLIVDIQIALSFLVVAFGIGVFISSRAGRSLDKRLPETLDQIENHLSGANADKLQEWKLYTDFMRQKLDNLKNAIEQEEKKRDKS